MRTILAIKERLAEVTGEARNLCNKEELNLSLSAEEYEVMDDLITERRVLEWVLSGKAEPIAYRDDIE